MNNFFKGFIGALSVVLLLSGCTPVGMAMGGAASLGVAAAQEGGVRAAATDAAIQLKITDLWLKHDFDLYRKLSLTVKEGRVLVTGSVPNPDMRVEAIRLAWQADGVRQVLNEIAVENGKKDNVAAVKTTVSDAWISSNLKTRLLLDKYIESINYNIDTANGTVYLMGVAQDQKELDRVIDYARSTNRVSNVVSYVRLRYQNPAGVLNSDVN
jgi:osmotically-inducible protein OsmY